LTHTHTHTHTTHKYGKTQLDYEQSKIQWQNIRKVNSPPKNHVSNKITTVIMQIELNYDFEASIYTAVIY